MVLPAFTLCSWQFVVGFPLLLLLPDQASPSREEVRRDENLDRDPPSGAWDLSWSEAKSKLYFVVFSPQ